MTRIFEDGKEFNYSCTCLCYLHACFCILNWNTGGLIKWIWRCLQKCFVAEIVKDFFGLIGGSCALFDDILLIVCCLLYYPYRSMGFSKGCLKLILNDIKCIKFFGINQKWSKVSWSVPHSWFGSNNACKFWFIWQYQPEFHQMIL